MQIRFVAMQIRWHSNGRFLFFSFLRRTFWGPAAAVLGIVLVKEEKNLLFGSAIRIENLIYRFYANFLSSLMLSV